MEMLRDHPDIESMERTGYPTWLRTHTFFCEECGLPLGENEVYEDVAHVYLCKECLCTLHEKW